MSIGAYPRFARSQRLKSRVERVCEQDGLQHLVLIAAYFIIPNVPRKNAHISYPGILWSMAKLATTEPLLIQSALAMLVSNMCFTNFWVTLTFLLLDAPFHYSS